MNYSKYQEGIFRFVESGMGHGIVEAVAGSGKTTTILDALDHVPKDDKVLFLAFNKHIADELADRVPEGFEARTCHSVGLQILGRRVQTRKIRNIMKYDLEIKDWKMYRPMQRVIGLLKANNYKEYNADIAEKMAKAFNLIYPKDMDWSLGYAVWDSMLNKRKVDFDDMIWLPVYEDLDFPQYDWVFVDEAQDLNPIQIEFISRLVGGRLIAVGDSSQAIYAFRGADEIAMHRIGKRFGATELPLSICYRCAKSIVKEAQKIVPCMESFEGQNDGEVKNIDYKDFKPVAGDLVLCRVNADLVAECLKLIRQGENASVRGRDIGERLKLIVKQVGGNNMQEFYANLEDWFNEREGFADMVNTIKVLAGDSDRPSKILALIDQIFTKENGVVFSTIHKSKGREAERVYIIRPDLLPHPKSVFPEQEENMQYVAITRAKEELIWVR